MLEILSQDQINLIKMLEHVDAHLFENLPLCIELSRVPLLPLTFPQRLEFFGN